MQEIQSDSKIVVEANETGKTLPELTPEAEEPPEQVGFFKVY
jgi:translocation and assembly module TamA